MNLKSLIIITLIALCACDKKEASTTPRTVVSDEELIKRGAVLVRIGGCNDCHSTKKMTAQGPAPDPDYLLAGHLAAETLPLATDALAQNWVLFNMNGTATVGPWGTSFAANLTPDDTGIGNWTYEQFEIAMREGKYKGIKTNRGLLPPMPWMNYKDMDEGDLRAIFAFLKSLRPVSNVVPPPIAPKM